MVARIGPTTWNRRYRTMGQLLSMLDPSNHKNRERHTSTVVIFMLAGFHRGRFQPSTHMAPKLRRLTVPSPSPTLIPFRICKADLKLEYVL